MIQYYLKKCTLPALRQQNIHIARVKPCKSIGLNEMIEMIYSRGTTLTRTDISGFFVAFGETLQSLLMQGFTINLPFAVFSSGVKGVFSDDEDNFDQARHRVVPKVRAGTEIKKWYTTEIAVQKTVKYDVAPSVNKVTDYASGEVNNTITPGGLARITGRLLRIDKESERQGIFFVAADSTLTKVTSVAENLPSKQVFIIPELSPGSYRLVVRSAVGKEIHEGALMSLLKVA